MSASLHGLKISECSGEDCSQNHICSESGVVIERLFRLRFSYINHHFLFTSWYHKIRLFVANTSHVILDAVIQLMGNSYCGLLGVDLKQTRFTPDSTNVGIWLDFTYIVKKVHLGDKLYLIFFPCH